jgi:putative salt-induced outer membrane protein
MMRRIRQPLLCTAGVAMVLVSSLAHADDVTPQMGWSGKGAAGLVLTRGNADTTTANVKLDAMDIINAWKHTMHIAFLYGTNASFATAQRLEGSWQTDYNFGKKAFVFGSVAGENDRFDGFVYQATFATGLGYRFVDSDTTKLAVSLGMGYRRLQTEELFKTPDGRVYARIPGESTSDGVASAGLEYLQQVTHTTRLTDKLLVQSGGQNTAVADDFAVAVAVNASLALSVGYGVRYNSNPPPGARTTDQLTTVNLVYNFNSPVAKR